MKEGRNKERMMRRRMIQYTMMGRRVVQESKEGKIFQGRMNQ